MLQYQQSEATAERRRWIIVLVDALDGVTGLTGQTGKVFISKNGESAALSTNSIVEVDAGDMPGHYYLELTAAELDTLGFISITKKTASSLAFHDRALISYNDPYVMAGGFSSGPTSSPGMTRKQLEAVARLVWEYKFSENKTAKDTLIEAAEETVFDTSDLQAKVDAIKIPEVDLSPVLDRIDQIEIPEPKDYTKSLDMLQSLLKNFEQSSMKELKNTVEAFMSKMSVATGEINSSLETVGEIKEGFNGLKNLVDEFNSKLSEVSDMDKRFENMTSVMQKQALDEQKKSLEDLAGQIDKMMKKILLSLTENKFDILQGLNKENG